MMTLIALVMLICAIAKNNDTYMIVSGLWAIAGAISDHITIKKGDDDDEV